MKRTPSDHRYHKQGKQRRRQLFDAVGDCGGRSIFSSLWSRVCFPCAGIFASLPQFFWKTVDAESEEVPVHKSHKELPFTSFLKKLGRPVWTFSGGFVGDPSPVEQREASGDTHSLLHTQNSEVSECTIVKGGDSRATQNL